MTLKTWLVVPSPPIWEIIERYKSYLIMARILFAIHYIEINMCEENICKCKNKCKICFACVCCMMYITLYEHKLNFN